MGVAYTQTGSNIPQEHSPTPLLISLTSNAPKIPHSAPWKVISTPLRNTTFKHDPFYMVSVCLGSKLHIGKVNHAYYFQETCNCIKAVLPILYKALTTCDNSPGCCWILQQQQIQYAGLTQTQRNPELKHFGTASFVWSLCMTSSKSAVISVIQNCITRKELCLC